MPRRTITTARKRPESRPLTATMAPEKKEEIPTPRQPMTPIDVPSPEPMQPIETPPAQPHVTMLFGYGKVNAILPHHIDEINFRGGVAHNVPFKRAVEIKNCGNFKGIVIMPEGSQESDWMRECGVTREEVLSPAVHEDSRSAYNMLEQKYGWTEVQRLAKIAAKGYHQP